MTKKILIITTNIDTYETTGLQTGLWLSELVSFYQIVQEAGFDVDIASPLGGKTPIDPQSLIIPHLTNATGLSRTVTNMYKDEVFIRKLKHTLPLNFVQTDKYDAIYLTGGHGVMFDYPHNKKLQTVIAQLYEDGKIVSAVCHGVAGLLHVTLTNGTPLLYGKRVTGYSWFEEKLARVDQAVPFNLEKELKNNFALYSANKIPFLSHVIVDDNVITGQNPKSTKKVAQAVVQKLQN